ncbi:MAG: hypothetical protein OQL06_03250 [Gammaproteobacteria bacterium]|nr:hypothetical protein [Gammaproteobacteria bacterium]
MNDSFLGFGPLHWIVGGFLWLVVIVAILGFYLGIRKKSKHENNE